MTAVCSSWGKAPAVCAMKLFQDPNMSGSTCSDCGSTGRQAQHGESPVPVQYEALYISNAWDVTCQLKFTQKMIKRELCPCRVDDGSGFTFFSKPPPPPLQLTEASTMRYAIQTPRQKIIWAPSWCRRKSCSVRRLQESRDLALKKAQPCS